MAEKDLRVTSDIWVHVFVRRETNRGAFATIHKTGAVEAGAIYVLENPMDGTFTLYGPAPQSLIDESDDDRIFETVQSGVFESEADAYLARQKNFDPDIWIVETQCRQGPPTISITDHEISSRKT
jgi:hypothetical protein